MLLNWKYIYIVLICLQKTEICLKKQTMKYHFLYTVDSLFSGHCRDQLICLLKTEVRLTQSQ